MAHFLKKNLIVSFQAKVQFAGIKCEKYPSTIRC